jgi:hypothetical protein
VQTGFSGSRVRRNMLCCYLITPVDSSLCMTTESLVREVGHRWFVFSSLSIPYALRDWHSTSFFVDPSFPCKKFSKHQQQHDRNMDQVPPAKWHSRRHQRYHHHGKPCSDSVVGHYTLYSAYPAIIAITIHRKHDIAISIPTPTLTLRRDIEIKMMFLSMAHLLLRVIKDRRYHLKRKTLPVRYRYRESALSLAPHALDETKAADTRCKQM